MVFVIPGYEPVLSAQIRRQFLKSPFLFQRWDGLILEKRFHTLNRSLVN